MAIVELIMPKMGESIIEATIINWVKEEGDQIEADEIVLEIATDKVDSEVPSPVSGILKEILYKKDDVVPVGKALALIEVEGENEDSSPTSTSDSQEIHEESRIQEVPLSAGLKEKIIEEQKDVVPVSLFRRSIRDQIPSSSEGRFYSPLVRNIARAEGITLAELNNLNGTGADGRVTKYDLLNYIDLLKLEASSSIKRAQTIAPLTQEKESGLISETQTDQVIDTPRSSDRTTAGDEVIELSRMRKIIADHMKHSLETAAHVTSFVEADATRLVNWRNKYKEEYQSRYGEKLTFSPLFIEAVIQSLKDFPEINGSFQGERIIIKKAINIGIATAMENGNLIVPVIKNAGELNLLGLTKKLNDLTARARSNDLRPAEIQGGTFTVSNIGTYGNIMGTPIINQPQLAVLALGAIKKKPVIQETAEGDIIAIRHMMFLSLSFDHRVIDGYLGGVFLNRIAHYIDTFDVNRPF